MINLKEIRKMKMIKKMTKMRIKMKINKTLTKKRNQEA